jgi:hypothetical protein
VPLRVLRGASNRVGDRDPSHWRARDALAAVAALMAKLDWCHS